SRHSRHAHRLLHNFHSGQCNTRRTTRALSLAYAAPSVAATAVADAPNRAVCVFAEQQTPILRYRDSNWPAPDVAIGRHKSGYEILHLAARFSILMIEGNTHDFIAGAMRAVPGAVKRSENIAAIFCRKLVPIVEA